MTVASLRLLSWLEATGVTSSHSETAANRSGLTARYE